MINDNLEAFGYIGDLSELLFDIFTGGLLSEQDARKSALATRLDQWNQFLEGSIAKLPEYPGCLHVATIDAYLSKEFSQYVAAWMLTDAPAPTGRFTIAKAAIDTYFKKGHYDEELGFYIDEKRFPSCGRQGYIYKAGLDTLAKLGKGAHPPSICAVQLLQLSGIVAMKKAPQNYRVSKGVDLEP